MQRLLITATVLALLAGPAAAQDKASKEREALRRAQTALREARQAQEGLQAEKQQLEAQKGQSAKDAEQARQQAKALGGQLAGQQASLKRLQAEMDALRTGQQQTSEQLQAAQQREKALQEQLLAARQQSLDRQRSNQSLVQLLERSTKALGEAEAKNQRLLALGQDALQRYLSRTPLETTSLGDPVLGLSEVRLTNIAEGLRAQMEQQRLR